MTKVIESHPELDELIKEYKKETLAEEALRLLESIPEDRWCTGWFTDGKGNHCAVGWLGKMKGVDVNHAVLPISRMASKYLQHDFMLLPDINDGESHRYQQDTPKQRVIALLQDMIKAGY